MTPDPIPVTILVVDDDEGHVELVRRSLRRAGIVNPIVALHSGQDALDYVFGPARSGAAAPVDERLLVLLDIRIPGGADGIAVLERMKSDRRTRSIPVIMLTTSDDQREIQRCYDLGCNIYISKPIDPARFIEAINRLGLFLAVIAVPVVPREARS